MPKRKLTEEQIADILQDERTVTQIAKAYGMSYGAIWQLLNYHGRQTARRNKSQGTGRRPKGSAQHASKLTEEQVAAIYTDSSGRSSADLAMQYGYVSAVTIHNIRLGKSWKHVTDGLEAGYTATTKGRWGRYKASQ